MIFRKFCRRRRDRFVGNRPEQRFSATDADRQTFIADTAGCQIRKGRFDDAVLQRMKGHHNESAARSEKRGGVAQSLLQNPQLAVDFDANRLKGALGRMLLHGSRNHRYYL